MNKRYILALGTFLLSLLLYIDRICISVAKDPVARDLGLNDKMMGWVLSAFALGYALMQTPSGMMADKYGPRKTLATIVSLWSFFTAMTGAVWNFISLLVVRLLFGAGEAGAFPSMSRAIFSWIPLNERGLITGINFSGSRLGAAFALPAVAWLIGAFGWRMSFAILGLIGVLWAVIWYLLFRDEPENHPALSEKEKTYIIGNRQQVKEAVKKLPFKTIISSKNMWLAMGQYFASNFTFFFALTWLFPHLKSKYQLDALEAGLYASAPLVFGALGNWFSGWMVDYIYRSGHWRYSRLIPAASGFILAGAGLVFSVYSEDVLPAVCFLSLAIFGADMTLPPSWSLCVDIGRKHSGAVSGTMNMAGNIGSFLTALAFPYLKEWTGSVTPFFFAGAVLNLIAVGMWLGVRPGRKVEEY